MQNLNNLKAKGQAGVNRVVELGKEPPGKVKTWGVTAGAAVAGGLALTVLATVATPPLALAIGAVGGGAWGWRRMHRARQVEDALEGAKAVVVDPLEDAKAVGDVSTSKPVSRKSVSSSAATDTGA
jgi:hypothetical protein